METIINIVVLSCLVGYITHVMAKDKKDTIRELTKALLAKTVEEYVEVIPEDGEEQENPIEDELEDVGEIDEHVLLKHLQKRI